VVLDYSKVVTSKPRKVTLDAVTRYLLSPTRLASSLQEPAISPLGPIIEYSTWGYPGPVLINLVASNEN
jgi:hypothetical protein